LLNATEDFTETDVNIVFNMDMGVDEATIIQNINASKDLLSTKSLLEQHPWTRNAEEEMKLMEEDRVRKLKEQVEEAEALAAVDIKKQEEINKINTAAQIGGDKTASGTGNPAVGSNQHVDKRVKDGTIQTGPNGARFKITSDGHKKYL
jgi:hypothetical protein